MKALVALSLTLSAPSDVTWREANHEIVKRIAEESRVETSLPRPSVWTYVQNVLESGWLWLMERVRRIDLGASLLGWLRIIAQAVVVGAALILILLVARYVYSRLRKRRPAAEASVLRGDRAPTRAGTDPNHWRRELEARLARSDVRGALEALWWWLASSLLGAHVDPCWTNRELLTRAGRLDLLKETRLLDRMRYGARLPSEDELTGLLRSLEKEMA